VEESGCSVAGVDVYDALAKARARGQQVVLVTVLAVDGDADPPR
jgi:hypothetical protein